MKDSSARKNPTINQRNGNTRRGKDEIAKESQGFYEALGQHVFDYGQEAYRQSKDMNKKGDPRKGSMYLFKQHVWMNQEMKNWDGTPV